MSKNIATVNVRELAKRFALTVRLRGGMRFRIGLALVKIGSWIAGGIVVKVEESEGVAAGRR